MPKPLRTLSILLALLTFGCDRSPSTRPNNHTPDWDNQIAPTAPAAAPKGLSSQWRASDAHTHLNPSAYPLAISVMDDVGLARLVNLSGGSSALDRRAHFDAARPFDERIAAFANLDWSLLKEPDGGQKMADQLEAAVVDGYAGLKISKALGLGLRDAQGQLIPVDTPALDPVWKKAGELGIPVAIHTGDPLAFFAPPTPDNERWEELKRAPSWSFHGEEYPSRASLLAARDRVLARHPNTNFILVHFANNPEDIDYVAHLLDTYPNAYVDVSARIGEVGRHPASAVRALFEAHPDRMLFGTDFMLFARDLRYRLTLGSISLDDQPPTLDDIPDFFRDHRRYFETDEAAIDHPVPVQGAWKVHPISLDRPVLEALYLGNAERIIFAPWLARRAAHRVADRLRGR